jgi:hypothetical protein
VAQLKMPATLHRMLGYKAAGLCDAGAVGAVAGGDQEELEGRYKFCKANPLETDALLVDKAATLEALRPKTQLTVMGERSLCKHACHKVVQKTLKTLDFCQILHCCLQGFAVLETLRPQMQLSFIGKPLHCRTAGP